MSITGFLRKKTKFIMVGVIVVLMVMFLVPSAMMKAKRGENVQTLAFYTDAAGQKQEITTSMLQSAKKELQLISELGMDQFFKLEILYDQPGPGGSAKAPEMAIYQLLFADTQFSVAYRGMLIQQIQQEEMATDRAGFEKVMANVISLAGSDPSMAPRYYLLLKEELRRSGMKVPVGVVDQYLTQRVQLVSRGLIQNVPTSIAPILARHAISADVLKDTLGTYLGIISNGQLATKTLAFSEIELKKRIRDQFEIQNIVGTFVGFNDDLYLNQVSDPTEEQLQQHFLKYKDLYPNESSDEDSFGFGYHLPDRVKVEYLKIDVEKIIAQTREQLAKMSVKDQENTIQKFWSVNRPVFRVQLPVPEDPNADKTPQYRDPEYDEVSGKARDLWVLDQANTKSEQILAEAKRLSAEAQVKTEDVVTSFSDYQKIALAASSDQIKLQYGVSDYLSPQAAQEYLDFKNVAKMKRNTAVQGLLSMMFQCEPLRTTPVTKIDAPPVKLYEDITPLLGVNAKGEPASGYLLRIVDTDAARVAASLADDGSKGLAANALKDAAKSTVAQKAKEDWKKIQAYKVALEEANKFAAAAVVDWDSALKKANEDMQLGQTAEAAGRNLRESNLEGVRRNANQLQQFMSKRSDQMFAQALAKQLTLLQKSMEFAQELETREDKTLKVLNLPGNFSCMVFKDISVTPPNETEYLNLKPLVAHELMLRNQHQAVLEYYNPANLEKRMGFAINNPNLEGEE